MFVSIFKLILIFLKNKKKRISDNSMGLGICCFCEGECNPCSQSCGSCSRSITGSMIGLNEPNEYVQTAFNDNFKDINKSFLKFVKIYNNYRLNRNELLHSVMRLYYNVKNIEEKEANHEYEKIKNIIKKTDLEEKRDLCESIDNIYY